MADGARIAVASQRERKGGTHGGEMGKSFESPRILFYSRTKRSRGN